MCHYCLSTMSSKQARLYNSSWTNSPRNLSINTEESKTLRYEMNDPIGLHEEIPTLTGLITCPQVLCLFRSSLLCS